jgi:pyrroline-5-carboxylate reductase
MKIAIIGAGNMGGAIACGLAQSETMKDYEIMISNRTPSKLDTLKQQYHTLQTTTVNQEAVNEASIVILAVKPWLLQEVMSLLKFEKKQLIVSVAAGVSLSNLKDFAPTGETFYRVMPNTAISELESVNLIAGLNNTSAQDEVLQNVFNALGLTLFIAEEKMVAGTALTSCGIAYVLKYIQAAMQAGVELGFKPQEAQQMIAQCVKGTAALLLNKTTHPSLEIDKVTTPGGLTIKGLNALEHEGFTSAIIKAMKASC